MYCSPWGRKEPDTTERLSTQHCYFAKISRGEGEGDGSRVGDDVVQQNCECDGSGR